MKKIIYVLALFVICGIIVGQNNDNDQAKRTDFRNRLLFGLKAGVNYSHVYDSKGSDFMANPKFGAGAGAFLSVPFGKYFGLQPEILFSQKGFVATGTLLNAPYKLTRTADYIDIPLLFVFKAGEFTSIMAGPQYANLIRQKNTFSNVSASTAQIQEFENDHVRKKMLGLATGMDLTLRHIVISARAGWDIQKNNSDDNASTPRYKNRWYQGTIGYRFYNK